MSTKRFNDTWTRQARSLGYPSRAVFKLIESNKKFKFMKPGQKVLDLGCAPGSWSKLASRVVGPKGFVMGIDINQLSHAELHSMGAIEGMEVYDPEGTMTSKKQYTKGLRRPAHQDYEPDFDYDIDSTIPSAFDDVPGHKSRVENQSDNDEDYYNEDDFTNEDVDIVNQEFTEKKNSYYAGKRGRQRSHTTLLPDDDPDGVAERASILRGEATNATTQGLLKAEQAIRRARSPVRFLQADVTEWVPEPTLQRYFDVIVSDMAPRTTGVPSHDAQLSAELCHAVLDLSAVLLKTPSTRRVPKDSLTDMTGLRKNDVVVSADGGKKGGKTNMTLLELMDAFKKGSLRGKELVDAELLCAALGVDGTRVNPSNGIDHRAIRKLLRKYKPANVSNMSPAGFNAEVADEFIQQDIKKQSSASQNTEMETVDVYHGALLMKCFQGDDFEPLLQRMKQLFVTVKSVKPSSSRSESVEIFLFGKGFRGLKQALQNDIQNEALKASIFGSTVSQPQDKLKPSPVSNAQTRMDREDEIERAALQIDRDNRLRAMQENVQPSDMLSTYQKNIALAKSAEEVYFSSDIQSGPVVADEVLVTSPRKEIRFNAKEALKREEMRTTFELGVYEDDEELTNTRAKTEKGKNRAAKLEFEKALKFLTQGPVSVEAVRENLMQCPKEGTEFAARVDRMRDNSTLNLVAEFVPADPFNGLEASNASMESNDSLDLTPVVEENIAEPQPRRFLSRPKSSRPRI